MSTKIAACLIVKNEAHVITRCLNSIKRLVDFVLIQDTGSTDGTIQAASKWMSANLMPGSITCESWKDFAANRTKLLEYARRWKDVDYVLIIDADEVLEFDEGFDPEEFKSKLVHDLYDVKTEYGSLEYVRPQLFRNRVEFYYRGVVHEFLDCEDPDVTRSVAVGFHNKPIQDGARSKNPQKFLDDANTLTTAFAKEEDIGLKTRYAFYIAQAYRDAGYNQKAESWYIARAGMGGWVQEVYLSHLWSGRLAEGRNDYKEAIARYAAANATCPNRPEAVYEQARVYRLLGANYEAYQRASAASRFLPKPTDALFLETWIYDYGIDTELSIAGYWIGYYAESAKLCNKILSRTDLSEDYRKQVERNLEFARSKAMKPGEVVLKIDE